MHQLLCLESELREKLKNLISLYPYQGLTSEIELFFDEFNLGPLKIYLVGLSCSTENAPLVTGSAGEAFSLLKFNRNEDILETVLIRAYFELLERLSILEYSNSNSDINSSNDLWTYSRSNGVANHTSLEKARFSAFAELCERDRILDFWYNQRQANALLLEEAEFFIEPNLREYYDWKILSYGIVQTESMKVHVTGIWAFPRDLKAPFVYGFGAEKSLEESLKKSYKECLQRMGFLWGEVSTPEELVFKANADFHQAYFLTQAGMGKIKHWLNSSQWRSWHEIESSSEIKYISDKEIHFLDITPPCLINKIFVVKSSVLQLIPLTFGRGNPYVEKQFGAIAEDLLIHPIV